MNESGKLMGLGREKFRALFGCDYLGHVEPADSEVEGLLSQWNEGRQGVSWNVFPPDDPLLRGGVTMAMLAARAGGPFTVKGDPADDAAHVVVPPWYYSYVDTEYVGHVYIRRVDAEIGNGLFARQALKRGEPLGEYGAQIVLKGTESPDNRYYYKYSLDDNSPFFLDGRSYGNEWRFANHARYDQVNVRHFFVMKNGLWHILFIAARDIDKNEELRTDYGEDYAKRANLK